MRVDVILFAVLAYQPCSSRTLPEDSVVSVYTTQPTTAGTHPSVDVYHQIANNIAERITSPIYRFLGIGSNKTETEKTTKKSWENIELLDEKPEHVTQPNYNPVDNNISENRDVEELSVEALNKVDRKPEKITLYSSYVPFFTQLANREEKDFEKLESLDDDKEHVTEAPKVDDNNDDDDDDDGLTLDDVDAGEARDSGYFVYFLEMIGSFVQLILGGLSALFKPKPSNSS